jgi:hypothetical protein
MEELPMRILLATIALATLMSSSAQAQYGNWQGYYGAYAQNGNWRGYYGAYAQVPPPYYPSYGSYGSYGNRSPYSVYNNRGQYIGSDPDPRVRDQLRRDPTQGD